MRVSKGEKIFYLINYIVVTVFSLSIVLPLLNVFAISLNDGRDAMRAGIFIWPRKFSLDAYKTIIEKGDLLHSAYNSLARTILGTLVGVLATAIFAYVLSHKELIFRKAIIFYCVFTMYFHGGLIPDFLLFQKLGLYDNFLLYIIPGAIYAMYLMIMRQFFEELPPSLIEAAKIDGAGELKILWKIIIPMALPVMATISLMMAVGQWTYWQDTYFFTKNDGRLATLQSKLVSILLQAQAAAVSRDPNLSAEELAKVTINPMVIRMATITITTLPIIMVYPFAQKYFISGITLGAVKE